MNESKPKYDCAIVGAGPAGSYLAYLLASSGKRVIFMDKQPFPRYKPCGGGISAKAGNILKTSGIDYSAVIQERIDKVLFTQRCEHPVEVHFDTGVIDMVMRDEFDDLLRREAIAAGADYAGACRFEAYELTRTGLQLQTSQGKFQTRYLAGADGVNSRVAKVMGNPVKKKLGFAVECELTSDAQPKYSGMIQLDHGHIANGYGWIFPKADHLSVGIGCFLAKRDDYRLLLENFLSSLKLKPTIRLTRGHHIPTPAQRKLTVHSEHALLVGDAAGLADPLSGEGIYYALNSAQLAAHSLLAENLPAYSSQLTRQVMPELIQAARVAKIIYTIPGAVHKLIQQHNYLARMLVEVVYGRETYANLFKHLIKANLGFAAE